MFRNEIINVCRNALIKPFFSLNEKSLYNAFENLSKNAFGLYLYLLNHPKDYEIIFSTPTAAKDLHLSEEAVEEAISELIEKHYFIQFKDDCSIYEVPLSEADANKLIAKRSKPINLLDLGF